MAIASFKPWQIVLMGGIAVLAGMVAVAFLAHLGYTLFPNELGWVALGHIIGTGAAWLLISKPFIEAYVCRGLMDTWAEIRAEEGK